MNYRHLRRVKHRSPRHRRVARQLRYPVWPPHSPPSAARSPTWPAPVTIGSCAHRTLEPLLAARAPDGSCPAAWPHIARRDGGPTCWHLAGARSTTPGRRMGHPPDRCERARLRRLGGCGHRRRTAPTPPAQPDSSSFVSTSPGASGAGIMNANRCGPTHCHVAPRRECTPQASPVTSIAVPQRRGLLACVMALAHAPLIAFAQQPAPAAPRASQTPLKPAPQLRTGPAAGLLPREIPGCGRLRHLSVDEIR
jgi:hypothetical protein